MSIRATNWAQNVLARYDLPRLQRLALLLLAQYHHQQTDRCFPSYDTLAQLMGCSRGSAIQAIKGLCAAKLIAKEKRRQGNKQGSNQYVLFGQPSISLRVNPALPSKAPSE